MTYTREQVVKLLNAVEALNLTMLASVAIYMQEDMDVLTQDDLNELGRLLDGQLESMNLYLQDDEVDEFFEVHGTINWVPAPEITDPIHHYYGDDPLPF